MCVRHYVLLRILCQINANSITFFMCTEPLGIIFRQSISLFILHSSKKKSAFAFKKNVKKKNTKSCYYYCHFQKDVVCRAKKHCNASIFFMRIEYMNYYYGFFRQKKYIVPNKTSAITTTTMSIVEIHLRPATASSTIKIAQHHGNL